MKKIPIGFCQCGCGEKAPISKATDNKRGYRRGYPCKFILGHHVMSGMSSYMWKGGRYVNDSGYAMVYYPNHPRANHNGYVREHIISAERVLGKELPMKSVIHHPFGRKDDKIFVICQSQKYHMFLHVRERAYRACGNVNWRKCCFCKKWDHPNNIVYHGKGTYHMDCKIRYDRIRYRKKMREESGYAKM